jgi:four helix bundle protein
MTPTELKAWTFEVAVRVVKFVEVLPSEPRSWVLGKQLLRSGTSVGAQYRAACRAQSARDFISKMKRMEEEADESVLWLALLRETGLSEFLAKESKRLESEFDRLTAIAVASAKTAERRAAPAAKR